MIKRLIQSAALGLAITQAQAASPSTEQVWQHHIDAWVARDLGGIVADYDESSLLILNGQVYKGPEEIRGVFARLFEIFDGGENRIDPAVIDGRVIFLTWHFTPSKSEEYFGTDTFIIEDGVIRVQTIASPLYDEFRVP